MRSLSTSASISARLSDARRVPAHSYFRAGKADALLIVCVPSDELPPRGDP